MRNISTAVSDTGLLHSGAEAEFAQWEVVKDLVDECIELMLNNRES